MTELEPCPYCGGEAKYHDSSCVEEICEYVSCLKCNAQSPLMYRKGEAVEWWNRRPSPWHTGKPSENGWYLLECEIGNSENTYFTTDHWDDSAGYWTVNRVIRWQRIDEDKEEK